MNTVLLSIKPQYANLIFSGKKRYELRKSRITSNRAIVYASRPTMKIVGEFAIVDTLEEYAAELWSLVGSESCISEDRFFQYFASKVSPKNRHMQELPCYALKIGETVAYDTPIDPYAFIPNFRPPQSFCYVDTTFDKYLQKCRKHIMEK